MAIDHRLPRIVIVSRKSLLEVLLERHGTRAQIGFYLEARGESIGQIEHDHERLKSALGDVDRALPPDQRRARVDREQLDRFLFSPDDIAVIVGQDGLIPNTAKYLSGQLAIGINPDPGTYDGVLCPHSTTDFSSFLDWLSHRDTSVFRIERRTMCVARREDGQELRGLNELFIGHRTHQSARYRITCGDMQERQSSSGVICATGTGATGWAASIARQRSLDALPEPEESRLAWFVREPFPSIVTGTELDFGVLESSDRLELQSEMGDGGVVFADGIESDWIEFLSGHRLEIEVAKDTLNLAMPARETRATSTVVQSRD